MAPKASTVREWTDGANKGTPPRDESGLTADLVDHRNPDAITTGQALEIANAVAGMKAGHTPETLYRQKLEIITDNVYGASKDGLAVSTAMLRTPGAP